MRGDLPILSLYTGAGGLDYGFEQAGFETRAAVEMDHDSCETLRQSRPKIAVIERSIFDVPTDELLEAARLRRGEAAVLIGGPPCQPFSKAGYWASGDAKRLEDPRADTLAAYLRVVEEALPQTFLLENVGGIAYEGKSEGLDLLLAQIHAINKRTGSRYTPSYRVLRAADYGVPQIRERFFLIAARDGTLFELPAATHRSPDELGGNGELFSLPTYRTAWDALANVGPEPDEDLEMRGKWARLLPTIPEGWNYLWHTERGGGLPLFGWRRRFWSFLLKLAKDKPSWTIQAQPGPAIGPFHWESRRLGVRELARLQTFPDNIRFAGGRTSVQRQIGNAVPSLLAEVLARAIRVQLLGLPPLDTPPKLLPPDRGAPPPPEPKADVPADLRRLAGDHEAHPGTGRGYRAIARSSPPPPEAQP